MLSGVASGLTVAEGQDTHPVGLGRVLLISRQPDISDTRLLTGEQQRPVDEPRARGGEPERLTVLASQIGNVLLPAPIPHRQLR